MRSDIPAGIADLHIHTRHSDGVDSASEVLDWAERIGLDVIAITDHDAIHGALVAAAMRGRRAGGPDVIVGEEVSSREGHILALFIEELVAPDMSAEETVEAIHEQGGLAVAAHPYWRSAGVDYKGRTCFQAGSRSSTRSKARDLRSCSSAASAPS